MNRILRTMATLSLVFLFCLPAQCVFAYNKRIALLIGNSTYQNAPLKNPANDATDMAITLKRLGFTVTLKTNATIRSMHDSINTFGRQLRNGEVGLFYYAGHGLQVQGRNYLIPIGARIESESDVRYEGLDAGRVLGKMEDAGNGLNIIILDACRNNPYARSFRSGTHGLAKMDAPTGSILAFSTAPGSVAADGTGRNGLYTSKLLKYMTTPNLSIEKLFKQVRIEVARASGKRQTPWESSSLMGDFYFKPDNSGAAQPIRAITVQAEKVPQHLNAEEEMWEIVKVSERVEDYYIFLDEYPGSRFRGAARLKIQQLKRKQNAVPMTSSIAPATMDAKTPGKQKAAPFGYPLAIFPMNIYTTGSGDNYIGPNELAGIKEIASLLSYDKRLTLTYCYKDVEGATEGVTLLENVARSNVWKKKSIFSDFEPDLEAIKKVGSKIHANPIILITGDVETYRYIFYLYDSQNDKVYAKKAVSHWARFGQDAKNAVRDLIEEFIHHQ